MRPLLAMTATAAAAAAALAPSPCCGSLPLRCAGGASLLTSVAPARLRCCCCCCCPAGGMPAIWRRLAKLVGPVGAPPLPSPLPVPASSLPLPACIRIGVASVQGWKLCNVVHDR